MALTDDFTAAQSRVLELSRPPTTDEMLELYALYKQATAGDANSKRPGRPGMLDFKGRAKYDAWTERKGTSTEAAMQAYVDLVTKLVKKYG
jgi:diazepam-binding inhibitor (GABA receptor modulator, acyl-CoA-binding protein)